MAAIIDSKRLSQQIREDVKREVDHLREDGIDVGLAVLLVGKNAASRQYHGAIARSAKSVGVSLYEYIFDEDVSINEILNSVNNINSDERINGLLIFFPLPRRINGRRVVNAIAPEKDIDGLGAISIGRLAADESMYQIFRRDSAEYSKKTFSSSGFLPCTPFGVIRILEHHNIPIKGKHAVIIGKSLAVGKPLSMMFLAKEATITVCHKATKHLAYFTRQADIVCSATGVGGLIKGDMIRKGVVVVDIGINVSEDGSISGDVDFDSVSKNAGYITPVPGGVGPVTIAMLLENTVRSARRHALLKSPFVIE